MRPIESLASTLRGLTTVFERLGISYLVGGSLASSARGVLRATMDVDLLARVLPADAEPLVSGLGADWYADASEIRTAILDGRSFNLIHVRSGLKVDVFPPTRDFHFVELERAPREVLHLPDGEVECPIATAEDILLAKLVRFRLGGEVSERQWRDVASLVELNSTLDREYLDTWAQRLSVRDLLDRASPKV